MLKRLIPKTIRGKIIACTAGVTLIITAITIAVCYSVFQTFLRRNQIQSAEYNLQVISRNVDENLESILSFASWCSVNADIVKYLDSFRNQTRMPSISSDNAYLRTTALNSYDRLKEEYRNTHAYEYISRVVISPDNCRNYLQISDTSYSSSSAIAKKISEAPFFPLLMESRGWRWEGLVPEPCNGREQVIPLLRPVYNQHNSQRIGWCYLSVSERLILNYLQDFPLPDDSSLYITIGDRSYQYIDKQLVETVPEIAVKKTISHATLSPETKAATIVQGQNAPRTMLTCQLSREGWTISYILSESDLEAQRQLYLMIILGISCMIILLGVGLYLLLNRAINQPVKKIQAKVGAIAQGDFSRDSSIEWEDEFGSIGKGINNMAENVQCLMNRRVEDEKQKKDLEYQILQSQINPHFLYNTLNSIKWMATIQNATGIAEMTTALARLLKSVSKGTAARITLGEELALVNDYFLIQQYRYGGSITLEYTTWPDELNQCLIHRFTLQPIIENALFHGIEPKGCAGKILLDVQTFDDPERGKILQISVTDNGVGMSEETIQKVLHEDSRPSANFFKQVGIHNVNKRIQYDCGEAYGIRIESKLGEYTTMMITLPFQTAGGNRK